MSDSLLPKVLGHRIVELRQGLGITQLELAAATGLSISTIYRAEQGHASIGQRTVARIALALSVDPRAIYEGEVLTVAGRPSTTARSDQQHSEIIGRLDSLQTSVDRLDPKG